MRIKQDSLHSRMKGEKHRDEFPSGEAPYAPSLPKRGQREELLGRLLGGEHRQYLLAWV